MTDVRPGLYVYNHIRVLLIVRVGKCQKHRTLSGYMWKSWLITYLDGTQLHTSTFYDIELTRL